MIKQQKRNQNYNIKDGSQHLNQTPHNKSRESRTIGQDEDDCHVIAASLPINNSVQRTGDIKYGEMANPLFFEQYYLLLNK